MKVSLSGGSSADIDIMYTVLLIFWKAVGKNTAFETIFPMYKSIPILPQSVVYWNILGSAG